MPSSNPPKPTDAELAILRILWRRGPSTVRDIHEALEGGTGYTTALKLMQIMAEKGLLLRDESSRTHIYRPAFSEAATQQGLIRDLTRRAFNGSAAQLVLRALSTERATPGELSDIRELLKRIEGGKQ